MRRKRIRVTEKGREVAQRYVNVFTEVDEAMYKGFSPEELEAVSRLLQAHHGKSQVSGRSGGMYMTKNSSLHQRLRKDAVKAPLFILIEAVCELFLPLLMANIIDVGINGDGGMSYIWKAGLGMLALSVLSLYSGMTASKAAAVASQGFGRNLRGAMFDKIQDFSFADIDRFSSASLITRLTNDVNPSR